MKEAVPSDTLVADAALYTEENIQALHDRVTFITRMPDSLKETKRAIDAALRSSLTPLDDKLSFLSLPTTYADVPQRMVVVFSPDKLARDRDTLEKRVVKQSKEELKQCKKLTRQEFAHEKDAQKALSQWKKKCKWMELSEARIVAKQRYAKAGRPCAGSLKVEAVYHIAGTPAVSKTKKEEALRTKGYFVLVTNELDKEKLSDAEVIRRYKNQSKVERGFFPHKGVRFRSHPLRGPRFRFLKDPAVRGAGILREESGTFDGADVYHDLVLAGVCRVRVSTKKGVGGERADGAESEKEADATADDAMGVCRCSWGFMRWWFPGATGGC